VSNEELMPLKNDLMMIEDDWDRIRIPVSLIHGTLDVLVPFDNLAYAKEKLVNADTVRTLIFEGENHFIVWSHKDEIVKEIVALMQSKR
jgi:pimeloyl-ACP methyl ester carboxylesterase